MNTDDQSPHRPLISRTAAPLNPEEEEAEPLREPIVSVPTFTEPQAVAATPAEPMLPASTVEEPTVNAAQSDAFLTPEDREALNRNETYPVQTSRLTMSPLETAPASTPFSLDGGKNYPLMADVAVEQRMRQISRRSFLWGAAALLGGYTAWRGLIRQPTVEGIGWPFRLAHEANERLARDYFQSARLAPTFPKALAQPLKTNGHIGLSDDFEPGAWKLNVVGLKAEDEEHASRTFTLADIKKLPRVEMVTELKCIEGWSVIVQWAGARFADFVAKYPPALIDDHAPQYVGMMTPDEGYFVGLDMESAMHPQTLLCYEMNGKPLTLEHGAPLRLVIPVKYGIKNIKRIGTIRFSNDRPKDYWAQEGYDWYSGH